MPSLFFFFFDELPALFAASFIAVVMAVSWPLAGLFKPAS